MKLRTESTRLRAFVRASVMRATVAAAVISAAAIVPLIQIRATTGRFFKRLRLTDNPRIASLMTFVLGRGFTDAYTVADFPDVVPNKRPSDTALVADVRDPFQIGKGLSENPKIEEGDYFAEDYTDPGYTIVSFRVGVTKPFSEPLSVADAPLLGFVPAYTDAASASDTVLTKDIIAATEKVLTADITDVAAAFLTRVLGNSALAGELALRATDKVLVDGSVTADAHLTSLQRPLADQASTLDVLLASAAKVAADNAATGDVALRSTNKVLADGAALFDGDITRVLGATHVDTSTTTDVIVFAGILGIIDAPSVADSGGLRMQDYCDFDYFAEDYVGEVRTF